MLRDMPPDLVRRAVVAVARWTSGLLFLVGLLGLLRGQFDRFASPPAIDVLWLSATPLGHLLLFVLGFAGIVALRTTAAARRSLIVTGAVLVVLGPAGQLLDALSFNTRMTVALVALGVVALAVATVGRGAALESVSPG